MQGDFFLTNWALLGMRWVHENVTAGHIVLTILIFTVFIRCLSLFGDIKSRKSSAKMQAIQPEIQKLQKKYKDNPQKLNQAQRALMRDRGVSMWGGCLPMLITLPLFFCFFAAFRYWGYEQWVKVLLELHETGSSELFKTFEFLWVHNIWQPDNGLTPVVQTAETFLATEGLKDLLYFEENPAAFEAFKQLGFLIEDPQNIPAAAIDTYNALVAPLEAQYEGYNNGWFILPVIAAGTSFLVSWLSMRKQPKPVVDKDNPQANAAQSTGKMMMYMMPAMSFIFCLTSNAAFAIYWTLGNVVSCGTTLMINRILNQPEAAQEAK